MSDEAMTTGVHADAATLEQVNRALETFNDKNAMNWDGPDEWVDWVVVGIVSNDGVHQVQLAQGDRRATVEVSTGASLLEHGAPESQFLISLHDELFELMFGD